MVVPNRFETVFHSEFVDWTLGFSRQEITQPADRGLLTEMAGGLAGRSHDPKSKIIHDV
jgi:hypothetical protein